MRFTSFLPVAAAALIFGVASATDPAWDVPPPCAVSVDLYGPCRCNSPSFRAERTPPETSVEYHELTRASLPVLGELHHDRAGQ